MKSLYILLLAIAVAAVSCRTKDGAPGPAGENTLTQQGNISGKITFVDDSGATVNTTFRYEYLESLDDSRFYIYENGADSDYEIMMNRRSADDSYNSCSFSLAGYNDMIAGTEEDPFYVGNDFNFVVVSGSTMYEFYGSNMNITNLHLDTTTGRLTFDYDGTVYYSNGSATVSGTADVTLHRVYRSMISWG